MKNYRNFIKNFSTSYTHFKSDLSEGNKKEGIFYKNLSTLYEYYYIYI